MVRLHKKQPRRRARRPSGGKQTTVKLKLPPLPPSTEEYLVAQLADAKWMPAEKLDAKIPAGAEVALIGADPMSTGLTMYMRTKAGYKLPAHSHTHLEYDTVIAGKGSYVVDGKKIPAVPGTFIVVPSQGQARVQLRRRRRLRPGRAPLGPDRIQLGRQVVS